MRPLDNPYIAGAGAPPPHLAGRDAAIAAVELMLARAAAGRPFRNPFLVGLRGAGKTVLLAHFETQAGAAHWINATKEIASDRGDREGFRDTMAGLARRAILGLSRQSPLGEGGTRLLRILASFAGPTLRSEANGPEAEVMPLPGIADSGDLTEDLGDLFVALGEAARNHGVGVLFLFDEIHNLSSEDFGALVGALQRASAKSLPIAVAAAGLSQPTTLSAETQTHVERLFETWPMGPLDFDAAAEALASPAQALSAEWDPSALSAALSAAECWPYFLQEWAQKSWGTAESSPIALADVNRAAEAVAASLDRGFFGPRYERANEVERAYLVAMASLGEGPCDTAAVAAVLSATQQAMSARRDGLLRKGLIYSPRRGQVAFAAPGFADFLARRENVDNFGDSEPGEPEIRVDSVGGAPRFEETVPHSAPLVTSTIPSPAGNGSKDQAS